MEQFTISPIPPRCPKWAAASFYDREKDEIYVPAIIGGASEGAAVLSLSFDGVSFIRENDHVYAPLSWMEREYPKHRDTFAKIRAKVKGML